MRAKLKIISKQTDHFGKFFKINRAGIYLVSENKSNTRKDNLISETDGSAHAINCCLPDNGFGFVILALYYRKIIKLKS